MSEPLSPSESAENTPETHTPSVQQPQKKARAANSYAPILIGIIALSLLGAHWILEQQKDHKLELAIGEKLSAQQNQAINLQKELEKANAQNQLYSKRLDGLEAQLAKSAAQQAALQTLYERMAQDDQSASWALAEVEQTLSLASQQLQLAGNVRAALTALETANSRLQTLNQPELIPLQRVIEGDIQLLKTTPFTDTVALSIKIDTLIGQLDQLPLSTEGAKPLTTPAAPPKAKGRWQQFKQDLWGQLSKLVEIRRLDKPEAILLTPEQAFYLRENIKLRLLNARMGLLQRDQSTYQSELNATADYLNKYFNTQVPSTQNALGMLAELKKQAVAIELPTLQDSLSTVRELKQSNHRGQP